MHYIYINMYTMCKTYGIHTTRGVARGVGAEGRGEPTAESQQKVDSH